MQMLKNYIQRYGPDLTCIFSAYSETVTYFSINAKFRWFIWNMKVTDNADKNECNLNVCKCRDKTNWSKHSYINMFFSKEDLYTHCIWFKYLGSQQNLFLWFLATRHLPNMTATWSILPSVWYGRCWMTW